MEVRSGFIWIRVYVIAPLACSGPLKAGFLGDREGAGVVSGPPGTASRRVSTPKLSASAERQGASAPAH